MRNNKKLAYDKTTNKLLKLEDRSKRTFLKKCNTYSKPIITLLLVSNSTTLLKAGSETGP